MSYNENLEFDRSNRVPLVFIADENFAIPTCVAIISLIENKDKDTFYDIFIIADKISIETEYKLFSLKKDDVNIQLIHISSEKFEGIHEQGEKSICVASLSALFKFEIPNILPLEDKILYLDGDILVKNDLKELFNINVENFYVAAAHDTGKLYFKRPIIKKIPSYFNSGVMLLNLKRLRENKIPELLIETKKRQKTNLMDQDVFNIVLKSGVKHIDIKYNFLILNLHRAKDKYKFEQINTLFNSSYKDLEDVEEKSHIIHFSSRDKPWKFVDGVYSKQWFSYFRKSPFRDPPNISDIKLSINEYSQEYAELSTPQNKIKKLKNQIKNLGGEVDQKNREINSLKWTLEVHKQLIKNLKAESRSIKQFYLEKNVSFSPDYGKLTVIIPYRKTDDPQREENLDINLNYLSKLGIKNLIISQHSDESAKKFLIEKYGNLFDYFKVYFSYADGKLFNKSCAINQGVIKSKTPYIAIFDIDGLTRKENIDQAIYLLDKGFEVVHPFDRLVKDIVDKESFIEDYDFEKVKSPTQQRDWADGGIVFWNKRSFIDIGMKNEHFTGWGSEDNEIIFRANIFQLKQIRIDDILYHLYHERLKVKTRDNFEKMKKMICITSKKELLKEINQWPWLKEAKKTIHEDHVITTENTELEEKLFSKKEQDILEPIVKDPASIKESDFKKDSAYKSTSNGSIYKKKKFNKLLYFLYILKKEKLNPKNIYKIFKAREQIKSLNLFDEKYYLTKYPHLRNSNIELLNHYMYHGWTEEKNPSRTFDGNYYLKRHPDVRKSKTNPLVHYVLHGKKEGRFPNHHAEINSPQNRLRNLENSLVQFNNRIDILIDQFNNRIDILIDKSNVNVNKLSRELWKYTKVFTISHINKEKIACEIEMFKGLGVTKEKRNPQIIVSLTSYPDRIYDIHYCLYSLLNQSFKPDKLILWLSKEEFPNLEKNLPSRILKLKKHGLEIKWTKKNFRSYDKLIHSLKEYPNEIIVTADDDVFYPEDWLERLYENYDEKNILAHRAHLVSFESGSVKPYDQWEKSIETDEISVLNFPTTGGGVLYPPNVFYKDVLKDELFLKLTPHADDIWFWGMVVLNNRKIKVIKDGFKRLTYINPERELNLNEDGTLYKENIEGRNDEQLSALLEFYPEIKAKLLEEIDKFI